MKKLAMALSICMIGATGFAKDLSDRFPAQATAVKSLKINLSAVCVVRKANLQSETGSWVEIAKKEVKIPQKEMAIKMGREEFSPEVKVKADDLEIEFGSIVNFVIESKNTARASGFSTLTVTNTKTKDVSYISAMDLAIDTFNPADGFQRSDYQRQNATMTLGYLDPSKPNSYGITCNVISK